MIENKEINFKELEKVAGGATYSETLEGLTYNRSLGTRVSGKYNYDYYPGTVIKQGYLLSGEYYWACIKVKFDNTDIPDGWYIDDSTLYTRFADGWNSYIVVTNE